MGPFDTQYLEDPAKTTERMSKIWAVIKLDFSFGSEIRSGQCTLQQSWQKMKKDLQPEPDMVILV